VAILLIKRDDNPVPESPGKWRAGEVVAVVEDGHTFGSEEVPAAGNFLHLQITDKTQAEVEAYTQAWSHDPTVTQVSATGDDRLIRITSSMIDASGNAGFDDGGSPAQPFTDMLADINQRYPTANATYNAHTNTQYDFNITAPVAARDEIIALAEEAVRRIQYRRRRWYVPSDSRDVIIANGGSFAATAADVASGGHLRDGLLD